MATLSPVESSLAWWTSWRGVVVLILGFLALYARSIGFDYVFDDTSAVRDNPAFEKPLSEALLMTQHEHHQTARSEARAATHDSYRPLRHLSLWIDQVLFGKSAAVFHAHNLVSGALGIWLVWLFVQKWALSAVARLWIVFVFAFHPAQVESVAYISGRSDVEASVFALLTLLSGYSYLEAETRRKRTLGLFGAGLSFFLCLAQKESFVLIPALLLYPVDPRTSFSIKKRAVVLSIAALTAGVWFSFRSSVISGAAPLDFLGALSALGRGLRQAIFTTLVPIDSSPVRPFAAGDPWVETILFALLGLSCVITALSTKKPELRIICFGFVWFALLVSPSLVAAYLFEVFSDHYLYLPILGLLLGFGAAFDWAWRSIRSIGTRTIQRFAPKVVAVSAGLFGAVCLVISFERIPYWENPRSLATLCVTAHPEVGRGWVWLAQETKGGCSAKVEFYRRAVLVDPDYAPAWNNLAVCSMREGKLREAEEQVKNAIRHSNGTRLSAWFNYGLILEGLGKTEAACSAFQSLFKLDPHYRGAQEARTRVCTKLESNSF